LIALITSTLIPDKLFSVYNPDERLSQTANTIQQLLNAGFTEIYLFDNSVAVADFDKLYQVYPYINIFRSPGYSFQNKGLNEALLILNNLHTIPRHTPIYKISGRYYPTPDFSIKMFDKYLNNDFVGKGYDFNKRISNFSTKSYYVKNAEVLTQTLELAVEEMIGYAKGIHGVKSFIYALANIIKYRLGSPFQLSLEQSFALIIKKKYSYQLLDNMCIKGQEAGIKNNSFLSE